MKTVPLPVLPAPQLTNVHCFALHKYWGVTDPERFRVLLDEATRLTTPGFFLGDNLFTWGRNNSLFDDVPFREAWQSNLQNEADQAIAWRRYILACAAFHCIQLPGDFVECGVFVGTGIKTVVDYLGGKDFPRTFWGYDTFDTNPATRDPALAKRDGLYDRVCGRFADYPQVRLVKGLLPDVFAESVPELVAYLHIDLNNAASELAVLEQLFDRVVPGGMIILDDYEWAGSYRVQKLSEDPWFGARDYRVFPLPTGQGLIFKR